MLLALGLGVIRDDGRNKTTAVAAIPATTPAQHIFSLRQILDDDQASRPCKYIL
jgi:hypothetical protein